MLGPSRNDFEYVFLPLTSPAHTSPARSLPGHSLLHEKLSRRLEFSLFCSIDFGVCKVELFQRLDDHR